MWGLRGGRLALVLLAAVVGLLGDGLTAAAQEPLLPIGAIQGSGDVSPYRGDRVSFRGVVTGIQEDRNTRGVIYYTLFVQALPGEDDGDPATSDGIAVFTGTSRPDIPVGAIVTVSGEVTEFFGFTEIDDDDLRLTVERPDGALPEPVILDPPGDPDEQPAYYETLEGLRVTLGGLGRVVGPTHSGCGLAVVPAADPEERIVRRQLDDSIGRVIPVLYPTDVDCTDMPQLKTGDLIEGLTGVLIYNFDEFKILMEPFEESAITPAELPALEPLPALAAGQVSAVTINVHDWFDTEAQSDNPDEPVLSPETLAVKEAKLAEAIGELLGCPTLVAIQEVENRALLEGLAAALDPACGFTYDVSHAESVDARGIDNGLLSDPRRVAVQRVSSEQVCSPVPTDHTDATVDCAAGDYVLFDRPPLQVEVSIDGRPTVVYVNHFKSKREGEAETALERLAQARFQNALAADWLAGDPALPVLVMGDLNDYEWSGPLRTLTDRAMGGELVNGLAAVSEAERYSYIFSGVPGLLDHVLVSPELAGEVQAAGILHLNADYPVGWANEVDPARPPYHFSDHDIPWIIWQQAPIAPTETPPPTTTPTPPPATATSPAAVAQAATPVPTPAPAPEPAASWWPWVLGAFIAAGLAVLLLVWLRR